MASTTEHRSIFDWTVFSIIHIVLIGAIGYAGFAVYGERLGAWVGASALIAGLASMYLFAKIVPGETLMKAWLGLCVALNAGYLVHNGAKSIGVDLYNREQSDRYVKGLAEQAQARTVKIAREMGVSNERATQLARVFDDGTAFIAAVLAFLELSSAIVIFSISSKRVARIEHQAQAQSANLFPHEISVGK